MIDSKSSEQPSRVQLHLVLPYKASPADHTKIRAYLDRGYRIEELQRITDREAVVTLSAPGS